MHERTLKTGLSQIIDDRIKSIDRYLSVNGVKSYDPYDGLTSPVAALFLRNRLLSRVWLQAVKYFPVNIRPMLGIPKMLHTKLVSDLASGYSLLFHVTGDKKWAEAADRYFGLLAQRATATPGGLGWGLDFPYVTRFVSAAGAEPNIFQTINAVQAFLDGCRYRGNPEHMEYAGKGFGFLFHDLGYKKVSGGICWNYWRGMSTPIYNVNGLMAGLTAQLWQGTGDDRYRDLSARTMDFLFSGQRQDGSWPYASGGKAAFTDGFHTGYILEGLSKAGAAGAVKFPPQFDLAVSFYLGKFFTAEGLPKYYPNSVYPLDGQNVAQAWQTLVYLHQAGAADKSLLTRCVEASDKILWDQRGFYYYRRSRHWCHKTPMHRWVTGPMFLALARLKTVLSNRTADG
jgi:hypothetical protein